jgi:hypothetical protein
VPRAVGSIRDCPGRNPPTKSYDQGIGKGQSSAPPARKVQSDNFGSTSPLARNASDGEVFRENCIHAMPLLAFGSRLLLLGHSILGRFSHFQLFGCGFLLSCVLLNDSDAGATDSTLCVFSKNTWWNATCTLDATTQRMRTTSPSQYLHCATTTTTNTNI